MEFSGKASSRIAVEVINKLLTGDLQRRGLLGSDRSRSGRAFFTLFALIRIGLFCGFLLCRLLAPYSFRGAALPFVAGMVVASHEARHSKQHKHYCYKEGVIRGCG